METLHLMLSEIFLEAINSKIGGTNPEYSKQNKLVKQCCAFHRPTRYHIIKKNNVPPSSTFHQPAAGAPAAALPGTIGLASVMLARTSEPPCFSVIDMPQVAPSLEEIGTSLAQYFPEVSFSLKPLLGRSTSNRYPTKGSTSLEW